MFCIIGQKRSILVHADTSLLGDYLVYKVIAMARHGNKQWNVGQQKYIFMTLSRKIAIKCFYCTHAKNGLLRYQ
jgi:hypothetical protein